MKDIETLFGKAVGEIERMLNSKTVVGEPIAAEGHTLIPLISVGFGFGLGAGEGTEAQKGAGGAFGGGGGVKPVAVIIASKDGVRLESIKGAAATMVDKLADVATKIVSSKSAAG